MIRVIVDEVIDDVKRRCVGFVAGGQVVTKAHAFFVGQSQHRVAESAALRGEAHRTRAVLEAERWAEAERIAGVDVHHALTIGSDYAHAMLASNEREFVLCRVAATTGLGEPRTEHNDVPYALGTELSESLGHALGSHGDQCNVRNGWQRWHVRVGRMATNRVIFRIHRVDHAGIAVLS